MEGPGDGKIAPTGEPRSVWPWPDVTLLAIALAIGAVIHLWLIATTEVAARDSINFIRAALLYEQLPWAEAARQTDQHPIYPLSILALSQPVRFFQGTTPDAMVLACQLASNLAAVLLVVPMFYLGRELFDRRVGFWAAVLYQCLPVSAQVTSDALSEAVFLLITTTTVLAAVWAFHRHSLLGFALAGVLGGLAYLTRPEGALSVLAIGGVLAAGQTVRGWRRPWPEALVCAGGLAVGALIVAGPYMATIGGFSVKPTAREFFWQRDPRSVREHGEHGPQSSLAVPRTALVASVPAIWWEWGRGSPPWWWGVWALAFEIVKGFQYLFGLPMLLGFWGFRERLRESPGMWVPILLGLLHAAALYRTAEAVGYLSERHIQLLILGGCFWATAWLLTIGDQLASWAGRAWLTPVLLGALMLALVPAALKPLHANRAGHRAAGLWLAEHATPRDWILDPFCWSHYYAGRVFHEVRVGPLPPGCYRSCYVVLDDPPSPHERLPLMPQALAIAPYGQLVYQWQPPKGSKQRPGIKVYQVPAP